MTLIISLVITGALALLLILRIALMRITEGRAGGDLSAEIQPVDLEAFRNLIDPVEADYLRQRLTGSEFRRVQRQRVLAVAAYLKVAARNAGILARLGQNALVSTDPSTVDAARQLVENALLLRRNSAMILIRVYAEFVWPRSGSAATPIVPAYERLSGAAMLLGRLQNPALPIRISA